MLSHVLVRELGTPGQIDFIQKLLFRRLLLFIVLFRNYIIKRWFKFFSEHE